MESGTGHGAAVTVFEQGELGIAYEHLEGPSPDDTLAHAALLHETYAG